MGRSIKDISGKIKVFARSLVSDRDVFVAVLMVLIGVASFGLGRLSVRQEGQSGEPAYRMVNTREQSALVSSGTETSSATTTVVLTKDAENLSEKMYVGSKNSDKYHLPWCSGAQRIAEENKVWFASKEEAELAGYTPAGNCKGI